MGAPTLATDEHYLRMALRLADQAAQRGEVPVAALVVQGGRVLGQGINLRETTQDPTAHAEIVALRAAARELGFWRLEGCTLYVTLEPCPMCAGALVNARLPRLVYGCRDPKAGAVDSLFDLLRDERLNHRVEVQGDVLAEEAAAQLRAFFAARRRPRA